MSEPSILASWTRVLRKQLDALGLDGLALSRAAGLDPHLMDAPNARYPLALTTRFWTLAVQASGDPALGLRVSRFISPTTFHALGYALVASGSLREVFERIVRYHPVVSDALVMSFERVDEHYEFRFRMTDGSPRPAHEDMDALAAIYVRTCRNRLGRHYAPVAVQLMRPRPDNPQPWYDVFRAPMFFGAKENLLRFACDDLDRHLDDANPELAQHNETLLNRTLVQLSALTWERKVRGAIETQLPEGEPSAEHIAHTLHLSLRSLQRHLADEGCRYDLLLNQCRQNLALQHMRNQACSLSEVAYLLGFADTSSFSRAFKRWTGMTPSQYREGLNR